MSKKWYVVKTMYKLFVIHEDDFDKFSPREGWFDMLLVTNDEETALQWIREHYVVSKWKRILRYSYVFN